MKDWVAWHTGYDDPTSSLSQRRREVTRLIRERLDAVEGDNIRVLSLCAGDARDLADALSEHPRAAQVSGTVIEWDTTLAARAAEHLRSIGATVDVLVADAGDVAQLIHRVPVDLLLLVGVFGNVTEDDVERTIRAVPAICAQGASVIWTRHRREPDLTPRIRDWFNAAGCELTAFVSPGPGQFAIGAERLTRPDPAATLPDRLFRFVD